MLAAVAVLWRVREEISAGGRSSREEDAAEEGATSVDVEDEAPGVDDEER